jgi:hypothetical protein
MSEATSFGALLKHDIQQRCYLGVFTLSGVERDRFNHHRQHDVEHHTLAILARGYKLPCVIPGQ